MLAFTLAACALVFVGGNVHRPAQAAPSVCQTLPTTKHRDHGAHQCLRHTYLADGRRDALVAKLSSLRKKDPRSGLAWYFEGRARLAADPSGTLAHFEMCRTAVKDPRWCLVGEALTLLWLERPRDALDRIQRARTRGARPALFRAIEARARLGIGENGRALGLARQAAGTAPSDYDVILALTEASVGREEPSRGLARLELLVEQHPRGAQAHLLLAELASLRQSKGRALDALQAGVAADGGDPRARERLASALLDAGNADAAIDHLDYLVHRHPTRTRYQVMLGEALFATNAPARALGYADKVLAVTPRSTEALELRARALIGLGKLKLAMTLRPVLFADPVEGPGRRIRFARALATAGHPGAAESEFAAGLKAHPLSAVLWRAYAHWHIENGRPSRAESVLRSAINQLPLEASIHADLADSMERQGNRSSARVALSMAVRLDDKTVEYGDELARLEFMTGAFKEAVTRWEALAKEHPGEERVMRRLALAYRALDRAEHAALLYGTLAERRPDDSELRLSHGEALLASGQTVAAVAALQTAQATGADKNKVMPLLAAALADAGKPVEADIAFIEALASDPGDRPLRLTYASFREDQGDLAGAANLYRAQLARTPRDADALKGLTRLIGADEVSAEMAAFDYPATEGHPELRALTRKMSTPDASQKGTVLRDERYVEVDDDGIVQVRHVRSVMVHTAEGAAHYADAKIAFHAHQHPTIVTARTLTPDGGVVDVPADQQTVGDPHEGTPLFGDSRHLELAFSAVEPGAIVDYEIITHRPHPDLRAIWWDAYVLANADPTVQARYQLTYPNDRHLSTRVPGMATPTAEVSDGVRILTWTRQGLPPFEKVSDPSQLPAVYVTNISDWPAVDRWYHGLFNPQSAASGAIADLARKLTKKADSPRAKAAAIYGYVERNVRYLGIEFGLGAYKPRPAASTLAQGRGDCKDMTALMVAMLDTVGVKAYPALVRPRDQGGFVIDHPSPGQFSHVLLYVPDPEGDLWLDATANLGTLTAVPATLREQRAFIVDGKGGRLVDIQAADPAENRLTETRRYVLNLTGGGRLDGTLRLSGDFAGQARRRLMEVEPGARTAILSTPGQLLGHGHVPEQVAITGVDSPEEAVRMDAAITHQDLVGVRLDGALVLEPDSDLLTNGMVVPTDHAGESMKMPHTIERRLVIRPPTGYRFDWTELEMRARGPLAVELDELREVDQTTIRVRVRFDAEPIDEVARTQIQRALSRLKEVLGRQLVILPGPQFDQITFLDTISAERPDDVRVKILLGRALIIADQPARALDVLESARSLDPEDRRIDALSAQAVARLQSQADPETALRALTATKSASPTPFILLAALYDSRDRTRDAFQVLNLGRQRHPGNAQIERLLAVTAGRLGLKTDALEAARRLADANPGDIDAQVFLGDVAAELDDRSTAEGAYRSALLREPDNPRILNTLAWFLRKEPERRTEAIGLIRRALSINPDMDTAWDTLAELYYREGQYVEALIAIDRALSLDSEHTEFYRSRRSEFLEGTPPGILEAASD